MPPQQTAHSIEQLQLFMRDCCQQRQRREGFSPWLRRGQRSGTSGAVHASEQAQKARST